ncbi:hypothetical protein E2C01_013681 [Portunus trituberculatus]|uniref:Uncharacterized protein n=1 Tax=Portunus trituberculatus TaxID=210409 RepID=A0A5B7DHU2_PORTR|nr:hypothetical protein [Portunus trituberculatus]
MRAGNGLVRFGSAGARITGEAMSYLKATLDTLITGITCSHCLRCSESVCKDIHVSTDGNEKKEDAMQFRVMEAEWLSF